MLPPVVQADVLTLEPELGGRLSYTGTLQPGQVYDTVLHTEMPRGDQGQSTTDRAGRHL
jgi:hypothetical protein